MQDIFFTKRTTLPTRTPDVLDRNYALLQKAEGYAYKTVNERDLGAYVFKPQNHAMPEGGWPVAMFFCSSGWDHGLPSQFAPHALYLASRGMAGVLVDYRMKADFPECTPLDAMADARSAMRWVRAHAQDLGIDPDRVAGCGGSAGAHAILSAAMLLDGDDPADDMSVSCVPNLLVLFSPAIDTGAKGVWQDRFPDKLSARKSNLMRQVRRKLPPMLLLHGTSDRVIAWEQSERFCKKNRWRLNKCRLLTYRGQGHGFFNFNFDMNHYEITLNELDNYLVECGYLEPYPDEDGLPRLS